MKIQPNFTAKYKYSTNDEERKQVILKDSYKISEALSSGFLTFGILESIDKFKCINNKQKLETAKLKQLAQKQTKHNILWGLAAGVVCYAIAWPIYKLCEPTQLKLQQWADKQNRIAQKAEQLINEEDKANQLQS